MLKIEKKQFFIGFAIGALLLIGFWVYSQNKQLSSMDQFATCIKNSGAKLYGTSWCPYCKKQKEAFGDSEKYLPYVECATPDGKGIKNVCTKEGIKSFPAWTFKDGSKEIGVLSMEDLAEKTSCQLPQ